MKKIILFSSILCLILSFLNLKLGYINISNKDLYLFLTSNLKNDLNNIVLNIRLSKLIVSIFVGISLSVSGFLLQEIFVNPLASPSVLGISSSSSLFVALFIFFDLHIYFQDFKTLNTWLIPIFSIFGALFCVIILFFISKKTNIYSQLILIGFLISAFTGTIISMLEYYSNNDKIKNYLVWSMGSISNVSYNELIIFFIIMLIGLFFALKSIHHLKGLLLGFNYAISLGINIQKVYLYIIISTSLLVGVCTSFVGPISFIGIIIPHFCRLIYSPVKLWKQFILNIFIGSNIMLLLLLISEYYKIPINGISSFIGILVIFMIMLKSYK